MVGVLEGFLRIIALCGLLALGAMPAMAAEQDPTLATLTSPGAEAVVARAGVVTAKVRVQPGVVVTGVTLNGRTVPRRVGPRRDGVRAITIRPADGLRGGRNVLGVATRGARFGRVDFDQHRFWLATPDPSLLTVGAPAAGVSVKPRSVPVVIRTRVPVERVRVWLNGRPAEDAFAAPDGRHRLRALLGPLEGLVQGRNVLRVEAVRGNRFERTSRVFRVSGACPLVSAGADLSVQAGQPALLRGSALAPLVPAGRPPSYSWRLQRAPSGSVAKLTTTRSARPTLPTDVPGRYVLRLTARQGECTSAPDTVTVNAFPQVAVPVSTVAQNTDGVYGVRVGEEFYPNPGGSSPQVHLVVIDRATLELQKSVGVQPGLAGWRKLEAELRKVTASSTVILAAPPGSALLSAKDFLNPLTGPFLLNRVEQFFGVLGSVLPRQIDLPRDGLNGPFSLISIKQKLGPPNGQATQTLAPVGSGDGSLEGNFVIVRGSNYAFSFEEFPDFDTRAGNSGGSNAIRVGKRTYPAAPLPSGAGGGFQVLVLDGYTLAEVSNQTFATNSSDGASAMVGMASTLKAAADNKGHLVLLTSLGRAAPQSFDATVADAWTALGEQIGRLGGTRDVFLRLRDTDSYSLVGAHARASTQAEASSRITPEVASGQLTGIIKRDDLGLFGPAVGVPGGTLNFELAQIAYQEATPWPDSGPGEAAANAYIAKKLDLVGTDVRANYTNDDDWGGTLLTELLKLRYPGGDPGFSEEVFEALRKELALEFGWVEQVLGPKKYIDNLKAPFQKTSVAYAQLQKAATDIDQALSPPKTSDATATWLQVAGDVLIAVGKLDPELAPIGAIGSVLTAGSSLATRSDGSPVNSVQAPAAELGVEFTETMSAQSDAIDALGEVIVSDYGKLKAVGTEATSNPAWALPPTTVDTAETRLVQGATQSFYGSLMPLAYNAWRITWPTNQPMDVRYRLAREETADDVVCQIQTGQDNKQPWKGAPDSAQVLLAEGVDATGEIDGRWWALGVTPGKPTQKKFRTPPASLTDPLFESLDDEGGIGLYKPWFFARNFDHKDFGCRLGGVGRLAVDG